MSTHPDHNLPAGPGRIHQQDLNLVLETQVRYALRIAGDHPTDFLMVHFLVTDVARHKRCGVIWMLPIPGMTRRRPHATATRYATCSCASTLLSANCSPCCPQTRP